ncbi:MULTISPECIES: methyl-accepting chemotaxis protein [unclassified Paenibacillus]|uniref:methyl-accepting chemotaxis protein n=1 Tax=unclassified Paenibacillus TaxID=185978 RepID=UPI0024758534|nr:MULTISPECIES: methyl-accepting chemotaxis protein [unclassified Paenibacillus]MDH6427595.1 methyl-accepting chemotaxis protein [Paenibacillus sp. PastH-4]MDH6444780.1 methyl-accepting chemotaxis protein [Paenibacillus sp. PastF-4]MDH6528676.1 methyl-accepting chemotaxis protein [Paenibacillus sp. PastH-3]
MKWFYNLRTAVKLISAFLLVSAILCFVGFYGITNLSKMDRSIVDMYENRLTPIAYLGEANELFLTNRINIRDINTMAKTAAEKKEYEDKIHKNVQSIEEIMGKYSKTALREEELAIMKDYPEIWQRYITSLDDTIEIDKTNISNEKYTNYLRESDLQTATTELTNFLQKLIDINMKQAQGSIVNANDLYQSSRLITFSVTIVALLISIGLGLLISQIIARPLNQVMRLLGKVANGDLSETSNLESKDEIGMLAYSVNEMVLNLRRTVSSISSSAESVSAAAQQISASTEEVASGSMSQASAAQTMNELFRELSAAINSVAQSAEQASELSDQTMRIAQDGGIVVKNSVEGMAVLDTQMSRLAEDSDKIGEIIAVIEDIAQQTNLLALNAAIEAARAGEQGRGFAVVANEVRKLAERSSGATKQITGIIKEMQKNTQHSVNAVVEGVAFSQKNGEAFEHILTMVNDTAHKVTEIAAASEEQAAQSSEVMFSIESISAATEEMAASSSETATTANALAQLAEELNSLVSIFKVK